MSALQRNSPAAAISSAATEQTNSAGRSAIARGLFLKLAVLIAALAIVTGCETQHLRFDDAQLQQEMGTNEMGINGMAMSSMSNTNEHSETILLREGDVLKITFPTAANLNTTTTIRRDGKIALTLVGDVQAANKTLKDLKQDILTLYKDQIDTHEMTLELVSSLFPVFVTGAVLSPHKVMSDHPITALEAIMECGGFDYAKANLKSVTVLRWEKSHLQAYHLNLKSVMRGNDEKRFYMEPGDILFIKEKFTWF
ncbi:MAG TPA: polysaccharide biosynthesis/export family protein [Verrucomicrobiae bacterium]|jgi:polysaccharide export outer membrane protein|nr:polysaccharide biosynthesis/export family protein [Verrucomicrobiae bacterium]